MQAIHVDRLIDGTGAQPISGGVTVVLNGDRIAEIATGAPPAGATLLYDGPGALLPGLIDAHVHLTFDGSADPVATIKAEDDATLLLRAAGNGQRALRAGITTIREVGAKNDVIFALKRAIDAGLILGPRLLVSGRPLTSVKGHCWFMNGECADEDELLATMHRQIDLGADLTKIMASGGAMTAESDPCLTQFPAAALARLARESHARGRPVSAHCHATQSIADSIAAGVDTIEHCSWLTDAGNEIDAPLLERLLASGIVVVPTLAPVAAAAACERLSTASGGLSPQVFLEHRLATVRRMKAAGVPMIAGSDAGVNLVPHDAGIEEIIWMTRAGFTPLEAIHAATGRSALAIGLAAPAGTLLPGAPADLVVVAGDPAADIAALRAVRLVVQHGRVVHRAA